MALVKYELYKQEITENELSPSKSSDHSFCIRGSGFAIKPNTVKFITCNQLFGVLYCLRL